MLVGAGADVSSQNKDGGTPLHNAAACGHMAVVRVLLDSGADTALKEKKGRTPIALASSKGGNGPSSMAALLEGVATRRVRGVAFAMGQHERLGAGSWVGGLDPGVVRMVLEHV